MQHVKKHSISSVSFFNLDFSLVHFVSKTKFSPGIFRSLLITPTPESGLADELGSGMRNTYKFTKLYSGGVPQFVEGDAFNTVIPLNETATMKSGSKGSD